MVEKLKVLDLFSGIGGFSLGLERTGGFETVAFCEIEKFPQKILKKHWPEVPIYEDVTKLEYNGPVDLVTAGFPCQDISLAGKGAGLSGSRSGLFWHVLRTACMVGRPKLLLENVAALLDRGMGEVLGALSASGYDAEWDIIPACAVGHPHHRERVWIIADTNSERGEGGGPFTLSRLRELPWGENVRRSKDWRERPDLHTPNLCRASDGLSDKSHRLNALGNAVVPQIPEIIGRAILANQAEQGGAQHDTP